MASSTDITFKDAPQLDSKIKTSLKQRNLWANMKDNHAADISPDKLMELVNSEIQQSKDGSFTEDQAADINKKTREKLDVVLSGYKENCLKQMEIHPNDTKEDVSFKTSFGDQIISWLSDLFTWLLDKIKEIFLMLVKKAVQWCLNHADDLFKYVWILLF